MSPDGITTSHPSNGERAPAQDTVTLDRLRRVAGAARLVPTCGSDPGRQQHLIRCQKRSSAAHTEARAPAGDQLCSAFALCASRHRIPFVSLSDSPAAAERPITTTSIPSRSLVRERRNHSRIRRFTRLRTTAPPTFRLTVIPSLREAPSVPEDRRATRRTKVGSATRRPSRPTLLYSLDLSSRSPRRNGPVGSGIRLLGRAGDCHPLPALRTPAPDDGTSPLRLHALAEAVSPLATNSMRLIGPLHGNDILDPCRGRGPASGAS